MARTTVLAAAALALWLPVEPLGAQSRATTFEVRSEDAYTRYELLEPESHSFRIVYDVTAASPGTTLYFNTIRAGSEASDEAVYDVMSGEALRFEVVSGTQARAAGYARANPEGHYIMVHLPRPVPEDGGVRLRIVKTYMDARSYFAEDGMIVFDRSLGILRNGVVLPAGYELVECNVPSQVLTEADGRIMISFLNPGPAAAPLVLKARRLGS